MSRETGEKEKVPSTEQAAVLAFPGERKDWENSGTRHLKLESCTSNPIYHQDPSTEKRKRWPDCSHSVSHILQWLHT